MSFAKYSLFTTLLFCSLIGMSQTLDEVYIENDDPILPTDEVSVIATAWFANSGCPMIGSETVLSNDTVYVEVVHEMGAATAICNSQDTTALGTFDPGTYTVEYLLIVQGWPVEPAVFDTAYTQFTVQTINSLSNPTEEIPIEVFPNPCTDYVQVATDFVGNAHLFNVHGQLIETLFLNGEPQTISTDQLESGLYLLSAKDEGATGTTLFIVK
jgi:hypothetical protein